MTPHQKNLRDLLLPGITGLQAEIDIDFDDHGQMCFVCTGPNGASLTLVIATAGQVRSGEYRNRFSEVKQTIWPHFVGYLHHFEGERHAALAEEAA